MNYHFKGHIQKKISTFLETIWQREKSRQNKIIVLLVKIKLFLQVNFTYGH